MKNINEASSKAGEIANVLEEIVLQCKQDKGTARVFLIGPAFAGSLGLLRSTSNLQLIIRIT